MIEHRLIERMIALSGAELERIRSGSDPDLRLLEAATDFMRTYADRTHHGKEENILFRELARKELSVADRATMQKLIREHSWARERTTELNIAVEQASFGGPLQGPDITAVLQALVEFYPQHIALEDSVFFPAAVKYLTDAEQKIMLEHFEEFDSGLIHKKYTEIVESLESGNAR